MAGSYFILHANPCAVRSSGCWKCPPGFHSRVQERRKCQWKAVPPAVDGEALLCRIRQSPEQNNADKAYGYCLRRSSWSDSLCTFFFITEAEIDASGLDGLGKGILHPARKPDRGRDSGNAGENICLVSGPEGKKSRQGITAQNHRKF